MRKAPILTSEALITRLYERSKHHMCVAVSCLYFAFVIRPCWVHFDDVTIFAAPHVLRPPALGNYQARVEVAGAVAYKGNQGAVVPVKNYAPTVAPNEVHQHNVYSVLIKLAGDST